MKNIWENNAEQKKRTMCKSNLNFERNAESQQYKILKSSGSALKKILKGEKKSRQDRDRGIIKRRQASEGKRIENEKKNHTE